MAPQSIEMMESAPANGAGPQGREGRSGSGASSSPKMQFLAPKPLKTLKLIQNCAG
jgi:hypothetical protein